MKLLIFLGLVVGAFNAGSRLPAEPMPDDSFAYYSQEGTYLTDEEIDQLLRDIDQLSKELKELDSKLEKWEKK